MVAGDHARDSGMTASRTRSAILDCGEVGEMVYAAAVRGTPFGAFRRAGFCGVLRLRLRLAFREAQPSLRMTGRRRITAVGLRGGGVGGSGLGWWLSGRGLCLGLCRFRNRLCGSRGALNHGVLLARPVLRVEGVVHFFVFADGVGFGDGRSRCRRDRRDILRGRAFFLCRC